MAALALSSCRYTVLEEEWFLYYIYRHVAARGAADYTTLYTSLLQAPAPPLLPGSSSSGALSHVLCLYRVLP